MSLLAHLQRHWRKLNSYLTVPKKKTKKTEKSIFSLAVFQQCSMSHYWENPCRNSGAIDANIELIVPECNASCSMLWLWVIPETRLFRSLQNDECDGIDGCMSVKAEALDADLFWRIVYRRGSDRLRHQNTCWSHQLAVKLVDRMLIINIESFRVDFFPFPSKKRKGYGKHFPKHRWSKSPLVSHLSLIIFTAHLH